MFSTKFNAFVAMITDFWDVRLCRMVDIFYILITVLPLSSGLLKLWYLLIVLHSKTFQDTITVIFTALGPQIASVID